VIKITGAWFVDGRAETHGPDGKKRCGQVLARDEQDRIWKHNQFAYKNPRQFVEAVKSFGRIDPKHWSFKADDSEAAAYYANHFEPGEPR
jgi:hypothetical protein